MRLALYISAFQRGIEEGRYREIEQRKKANEYAQVGKFRVMISPPNRVDVDPQSAASMITIG